MNSVPPWVQALLDDLESVKCNGTGDSWSSRCPGHEDEHASLSVTFDGEKILLCDHAGCMPEHILASMVPRRTLRDLFPPKEARAGGLGEIVATYDYLDEGGALRFQVVRFQSKQFRQRRPNGSGGWIWDLKGIRTVLYHLPELRQAVAAGQTIYLPEGEKDVDRLRALGLAATCNPMGAGKWRDHYAAELRGADVIILPDNDEAGRSHADAISRSLAGVAARVRLLALPGIPEKGDVSDWLAAGGTREELERLADVSDVSDFPGGGGEADGAALLSEVHAFLGRFIAYPDAHAAIAHTLWAVHTHLMEAWESTPRLAFLSPEPSSGKTRGLEATELLVPNPVEAVNVSSAYLFRKIAGEDGLPTVLFDEIDTIFGPKAKEHEEVRGVLNAGHRRGAVAGRCAMHGKRAVTEELSAYCAVAIAGLGSLPETILTRSVIIRMRRRGPKEHVEPFRRRVELAAGHGLRDRLARWSKSVQARATAAWPKMPAGIEDRDADVWEALLAVADLAGGEWPKTARAAAVAMVAAAKASPVSLGVRLLADLKAVFGDAEVRFTVDLLRELTAMDEAPWSELRDGNPLNARGLARYLSTYGVKSQTVRAGEVTAKGYKREDLADPWARYVPPPPDAPPPPEESVTSDTSDTQGADCAGNGQEPSAGEPSRVTDEPSQPPRGDSGSEHDVTDVTDVTDFSGDRETDGAADTEPEAELFPRGDLADLASRDQWSGLRH